MPSLPPPKQRKIRIATSKVQVAANAQPKPCNQALHMQKRLQWKKNSQTRILLRSRCGDGGCATTARRAQRQRLPRQQRSGRLLFAAQEAGATRLHKPSGNSACNNKPHCQSDGVVAHRDRGGVILSCLQGPALPTTQKGKSSHQDSITYGNVLSSLPACRGMSRHI